MLPSGDFVMSSTTIPLAPADMEAMIRRIVKEAVREELDRLRRDPAAILLDWRHEGPDDPRGDEILLRDALAQSRRYRDSPEELTSLEDFQKELAEAEAAALLEYR